MKKYVIGFFLIGALLLSGCSFGSSIESRLSNVLSTMFSAEEKYREVQTDLKDLETKEQIVFKETMALTQEQPDELKINVDELETLLEERLVLISKEEESMKKAKESISLFDEIIEKADKKDIGDIEKLKEELYKRYSSHAEVVVEYIELASIQKELYAMLKNETTNLAVLQEKVEDVNKQNETVQQTIQKFNESTTKVNELKEDIMTKLEGN